MAVNSPPQPQADGAFQTPATATRPHIVKATCRRGRDRPALLSFPRNIEAKPHHVCRHARAGPPLHSIRQMHNCMLAPMASINACRATQHWQFLRLGFMKSDSLNKLMALSE